MKRIVGIIALAISIGMPAAAQAQQAASFPVKPIKLIVPTGPGGSMDLMARAVAEEAGRRLGQPMVVENKPGAGNTMAAVSMLAAEPDGYMLGLISCATLKLPHVSKSQYDPMKDLVYISRISDFALIVAVRADSPLKSMADLVQQSKSTKGLFYGTAGTYNSPHLATIRLAEASGAKLTNVPYKGDADAITALLAGDIQFVASSNSVIPYIQSGKLRALGVYGERRIKGVLDATPTMTEQGIAVVETCPFGIMGPKGLATAIVARLDAAFQSAVNSPTVKSVADKFGFEPDYLESAGFDRWARQSFEADRALFRKLGKNPE